MATMSTEFRVPALGEHVEAATVAKVLVAVGDAVVKDQPVVELETDKAVAEVPCDRAGKVEKVHVHAGEEVHVGQPLLTISGADAPATDAPAAEPAAAKPDDAPAAVTAPEAKPAASSVPESEPAAAAPSVRRLARELGIAIADVVGSGPHGRISIDDVKAFARGQRAALARGGAPSGGDGAALPDLARWGEVTREPMSAVRRLTAARMSRAWALVPQATQFGKADVAEAERLRQRFKQDAEKAGGHLSLTVLLIKAVVGALKAFPRFNPSFLVCVVSG